MSIPVQQEPKYDITEKGITNRQSGESIPFDEPVFILRARDLHAIKTLGFYSAQVNDPHHREVIEKRINQFEGFALLMPERMKEPDTDKSIFNDSKDGATDEN